MKNKSLLVLCAIFLTLQCYSYGNESAVEVVNKFIHYCKENNKAEAKKLCNFSTFDVLHYGWLKKIEKNSNKNFDYLMSNIGSFTQARMINLIDKQGWGCGGFELKYKVKYSIASQKPVVNKNKITIFVDANRMIQFIGTIPSKNQFLYKYLLDVKFPDIIELAWTLENKNGSWKIVEINCYAAPPTLNLREDL